ncbi:MAG: HAD hydrolase-like protein, partial [Brachybacterium sp.]|nr:HAD hydrolase-like protein [Brachybacterium sp.]
AGQARIPHPEMVHALLARHSRRALDCLAVGDRPTDVAAARAAGVRGVLLETPGVPLAAGDAERVTSLGELLLQVGRSAGPTGV